MTDQQFQQAVIKALASIQTTQHAAAFQLTRLEAAVLGNPAEGVDGLMTRMKTVEDNVKTINENTPGKVKRAMINGGAGVSGGAVVLFLMNELWPVVKGLFGA